MEKLLDSLKEELSYQMAKSLMVKQANVEENRKKFQKDMDSFLHKVCTGYPIPLAKTRITCDDDGLYTVDIMSAFRNYPISRQIDIACQLAGVKREWVDGFNTDPQDGHITELHLLHHVDCDIKVKVED
jgi:hypothetical protein